MTDHTRTENIGGDSILFLVVLRVVAGNRYDNIEFVEISSEKIQIVRERLKVAQGRQKSYADNR